MAEPPFHQSDTSRPVMENDGGANAVRDVSVLIGDTEFVVSDSKPLHFGRADTRGTVGLDPGDMGISSVAGSVERMWGLWWIVNRGRKRTLLLGDARGGALKRVPCGERCTINQGYTTVLVSGAIYTHVLEIVVPHGDLPPRARSVPKFESVDRGGMQLSEIDKDVLMALGADYLRSFPHRPVASTTYEQAAQILGPPWTRVAIRNRVRRLRQRAASTGPRLLGPDANFDLIDHLIVRSLLIPSDLERISRST